jgi:serpin B
MKLSFGFEASELLKALGLRLPFSPEEADLSGLVADPPVSGTEAAAASAVVEEGCCAWEPQGLFHGGPPFRLLDPRRHDRVFVGHVVNPLIA